jgi:hypothetical protein
LNKQLSWYHELERQSRAATRKEKPKPDEETEDDDETEHVSFPQLVIVSPGRPTSVLEAFGGSLVQPGVYRLVRGLETSVVVASELERTRATLMLRLAGQGRVLYEAIEDMKKLPEDTWERCVANPVLIRFRLDVTESVQKDGEDMTAEMQAWFEDYQSKLRDEGRKLGVDEGRKLGVDEGRKLGVDEGERRLLLSLLRSRFGDVPASTISRIDRADGSQIERWGERVLSAKTLDEVFELN